MCIFGSDILEGILDISWLGLLEVNTIFATVCHVSAILLLIGSLDFPSWKPDSLSANPVAPEPSCDKPPPFAPRGFP